MESPVPAAGWPRRACIALAVLWTAACRDGLMAPAAAPSGPAVRTEEETEYELFSGTARPRWTAHGVISDSGWILVEVVGKVSYSRNPACFSDEYKGWCDGPPVPVETEGPYGPVQARGEVKVALNRVGYPGPTEHSSGTPLYGPGGDVRGPVGRLLFRNVAGPQYLWTRQETHQTYAGNPTNPLRGYFPVFLVGGEQKVSVRRVPTPLRIAGPARVAPGQPAAFTAEPVGDFHIRDPQGRRPVAWQFLPGDTLEQHNPRSGRVWLDCESVTCEYAPARSGRLMAHTYVEGQPITVTSAVIRVDTAGLELTCADSVLRGQSIQCSVRAKPTGQLSEIHWTFADDRGHRITGPPEGAWGGTMVIGGTIVVSAKVDGRTVPAKSQRIHVIARDWRDHLPPGRVEYQSCPRRTVFCPQSPLARERDAGVTFLPPEQLQINFRAEPVVEGPNAGWWYVSGSAPPVQLPGPVTRLNPDLFDPRSGFYTSRRNCRPEDVQYWIRTHESAHVAIGYERAQAGWINPVLEGRMAFRPATDPQFYQETVGLIRSRLQDLLDGDHDLRHRYPAAPCDLDLSA